MLPLLCLILGPHVHPSFRHLGHTSLSGLIRAQNESGKKKLNFHCQVKILIQKRRHTTPRGPYLYWHRRDVRKRRKRREGRKNHGGGMIS